MVNLIQLVHPSFSEEIMPTMDTFLKVTEQLQKQKPNCCYFFNTSFGLEYSAIGLWEEEKFQGSIFVGPFLSNAPNLDFINRVISSNQLPLHSRKTLQDFYDSLIVVHPHELNHLNVLLTNLFSHPYVAPQLRSSDSLPSFSTKHEVLSKQEPTQQTIEARYKFENELMSVVAKGDGLLAIKIMDEHLELIDFSYRASDNPIRAYKNLLFSLNTLNRKAAEKGGVHPIYLHSISEKFAIMIERTKDLPTLYEIRRALLMEYSESVRTYSNPEYSDIVKRAIHYILLHIDYPLTLEEIAKKIYVNPAHLSRKFKSETHMTLTQYIHYKKIEEAKPYLEKGSLSITEIALLVGFNDSNYFGKVFKKVTGMTPSLFIANTNK
ncbi:helix-turn-helix domain-containing protein [Carnobacterium antarcticum]|uniref:Helix-turn-helix domain-containing protein n=1 Tax=Carnobacterium antarcticum TaxID=2126436 RepID=A0ABW4NKM5_9LACT|nr:helix-turn-helix domain-containing protein [Carnobacterium sp. CP1]ALV22119.1 Two-component response regulator yesN [Carnobacterium sp. CP1]